MLSADVIIIATGYKRPSIDFLPNDLFPKDKDHDYSPPSLYLQNFSVEDWSILMTNASYQDAIGTVGNWHIGIYARILMVFLLDESTRPVPFAMKSEFLSLLLGPREGGIADFYACSLVRRRQLGQEGSLGRRKLGLGVLLVYRALHLGHPLPHLQPAPPSVVSLATLPSLCALSTA